MAENVNWRCKKQNCPKVIKRLLEVCWGSGGGGVSNKHATGSGSRVSASYGHFVMAYEYGYCELYETAVKIIQNLKRGEMICLRSLA